MWLTPRRLHPKTQERVEGLDFDQTYGALTSFVETGQSSVTLVLKRLVKRQPMTVAFQFSPSDDEGDKGLKPWTKEVRCVALACENVCGRGWVILTQAGK